MLIRMNPNFFKGLNENFSLKIFVLFAFFVFIVLFSFAALFIHLEEKSLNDSLIRDGKLLARISAHNIRIGVFSENKALLNDQVTSVFQKEDILDISIYKPDGELLIHRTRSDTASPVKLEQNKEQITHIFKKLIGTSSAIYYKEKGSLIFWAPVLSRLDDSLQGTAFSEESSLHEKESLLGCIGLTVGKDLLNKQVHNLLSRSLLFAVLFFIAGSVFIYSVIKRLTKPLDRLTVAAKNLGAGKPVETVRVETKDEIGNLANAFNNMAESLKRRDKEIKAKNQELMKEYEQRKFLSKRLIDLLEKDREHLAIELHDHVGQALISLKINLEIIQEQLKPEHLWFKDKIKACKERTVQVLKDIKYISKGLKPSVLNSLGLVSSIKSLLREIEANTDIEINFFSHKIPVKFGKEKELAIYRITQEALSNIIMHTQAGTVFISLVVKNGRIALSIEDNGAGFDIEKTIECTKKQGNLGLLVMQERAEQLSGEFSIESATGKGTHLLVEIPI